MALWIGNLWQKLSDYTIKEIALGTTFSPRIFEAVAMKNVSFFSEGFEALAPRIVDDANAAGRFFLVVYNTSTTVSAAYATFIVLAISFALAAIFGLLYYGIASSFSGSGKIRVAMHYAVHACG